MELLKHLKVNSSTFHLRAKEEVDEGTIIDYNKIKIENCDVVYTDYYYDNDLNEEITITTNRFAYFNYLEIIDNFNMNFSFLYFDEEQNKYITQYCHIMMMWYPTN